MKKIFISAIILTALISCGGGEKKEDSTETKPAATETPATAANPYEDKAMGIIASSDCLTCHKVDETVTGPAYIEVAKKYENTEANVNMLVDKVIKGGKGNWGEVPMLAHETMSRDDAKTVVQYILSLRK